MPTPKKTPPSKKPLPKPPLNGKGRARHRPEDVPPVNRAEHPTPDDPIDIHDLFPQEGADPLRPGKQAKVFKTGHGPYGRYPTRSEIRNEAAALLQNSVLPLLGLGTQQILRNLVRELRKNPDAYLDGKALAAITGVGHLFAQIGVGFMGANQVDPADLPNLPPPVINTMDPSAALPDGKPD